MPRRPGAALARAAVAVPEWNWNAHKREVYEGMMAGPARHQLLVGGARSGKTALVCRAIGARALQSRTSRHAILRLNANAAWSSIAMDTLPKVFELCWPGTRLKEHSDGYLTTPWGAEIWIGGLGEKAAVERILGKEFAGMFINEGSQISYQARLIARTRLAQVCYTDTGQLLPQRDWVDLNPVGKSHWSYREFILKVNPENRRPHQNPDDYQYRFLNPLQNAENLTPEFIAELEELPVRQRRRFYEGVYVDEIENALWSMECIDQARCFPEDVPETLDRVNVAIDPSGTAGEPDTRSDEVGIVVAGRAGTQAYVLQDLTCNLPPEGWGRTAVIAYHEHKADRIVAEANYGGDMVRATIAAAAHAIDSPVPPVHMVTASRGKAVRAEPVSVLYGYLGDDGEWRNTRVHHAGTKETFLRLEEELLNFSTAGYMGPKSPNRGDALVWSLTDLMLEGQQGSLWGQSSLR